MKRARFKYPISPLEAVIIIHHVLTSDDAENDADRTVEELVSEIDDFDGYISKAVLEAGLYCCNMEAEKDNFWHPFDYSFEKFIKDLLPRDQQFDRYYNYIKDKEKDNGPDAKTGG